MRAQGPLPGDRVTIDPTNADEEVLPMPIEEQDDDDIVPGPLDEEQDDTPVPDSDDSGDDDLLETHALHRR